jgi:ABC-2 type transport system permease protein
MSAHQQRMRRWLAVARIEVLHLIHDRPALSLIVVVPALQILLFGYAVSLDPRDVPIAIAREEAAPEGILTHAIADTGSFRIIADGLKSGGAARLVASHKALVGIELPPVGDLSEVPDASPVARPRAIIDATDPATVRPAVLGLEAALWRRLGPTPPSGRQPLVQVDWLYNPERRTTWAIAPGLAGVVVMITTLLLGALTLVRERERGTWEALLATPVSGGDAVIGKLSPYVLLGVAQAAIVVAVAHLLFDLPVRGQLATLLSASALLALAHLTTGFALSALARTQLQAILAAVFFYLPSMLLSGFIFPFSGMPRWAQALGEALPLTHFVRVARGVLLRADGSVTVVAEMWPVAAFTVVAIGTAVFAYRYRLE